jgi:hypothetical protein
MSEMHDTENALARAVKAIYDASDLNRERDFRQGCASGVS